jgi:hypothetical protein
MFDAKTFDGKMNGQLELSLASARAGRPMDRRQRRLSRAQWWFERMRQAVDRAMDWEPAPPVRPEQTWFANVQRQVAAAGPGVGGATETRTGTIPGAERQMCE